MAKRIELPFDCPHCGKRVPDDDYEEATVGNLGRDPYYPHIRCPHCRQCCGCCAEPKGE